MRNTILYKELKSELNFEDNSVGIQRIDIKDTDKIKEVLKEFNLIYVKRDNEGVYFKGKNDVLYKIENIKNELEILEVI